MLQVAVMATPACWLMSDATNTVTGRRFTACDWDASLPADEAAAKAGRGIGWPELAPEQTWW